MAKERIFDLQETKGNFQIKGIVSGTKKDDFYKESKTKTGKPRRVAKFRVEYNTDEALTVSLSGMEQANVYFSKRAEKQGEKSLVEKVAWHDRFSFSKDGFRLIGCNIGITKKIDADGKEVNDKKTLTDFDACAEIGKNLKDDVSVYVKGNIDYSSFNDDEGNKRSSIKLEPSQISLCSPVDFKDEKYKQANDFNQVIIFMGIDKEKDDKDKETGRFVVSAKIVTYSTIEDVEFIIEDNKLAQMFRKNLKPYYAIKVSGHIVSSIQTENVSDDDEWGEADAMTKILNPVKREFIITGAKGSTVDKELYTKDKVDEALEKIALSKKAESDFGIDTSDDDWGSAADIDDSNDEDEPW